MKLAIIAFVFGTVLLASTIVNGNSCNARIPITKPTNIYTDHGDGTVTDIETGLMWQQCTLGLSGTGCATGSATLVSWKEGLEAAQVANLGLGMLGYSDWRLPSVAELRTLVETACYDPSINITVFPSTKTTYWSATPNVDDTNSAWEIQFFYGLEEITIVDFDGATSPVLKSTPQFVRLVRGGY